MIKAIFLGKNVQMTLSELQKILSGRLIFSNYIKSPQQLVQRITQFPALRDQVMQYLFSHPAVLDQLIRTLSDRVFMLRAFPLYHLSFSKYFSKHKEVTLTTIDTATALCQFKAHDLKKAEDLLKALLAEPSQLARLAADDVENFLLLYRTFPQYKQQLIQQLLKKDNALFQNVVKSITDIKALHEADSTLARQCVYKLLQIPSHFKVVVPNLMRVKDLVSLYPIYKQQIEQGYFDDRSRSPSPSPSRRLSLSASGEFDRLRLSLSPVRERVESSAGSPDTKKTQEKSPLSPRLQNKKESPRSPNRLH